jgi:hypothetical protein
VTWHLYEARRFLGELARPIEATNADRLEAWLLDRCRRSGARLIATRDVLRTGPNAVRKQEAFAAAMKVLSDAGRARFREEGKRRWIELRPELMREAVDGAT